MSLTDDLGNLLDAIEWYADPNNYDESGVAGEPLLFGRQPDLGDRARAVSDLKARVLKQVSQLKQEVKEARAEKRQQVHVFSGAGIQIDVWARTFLCTQRIPVLAAAYQGYSQYGGLGAVFVGIYWRLDDAGKLRHQAVSDYLTRSDIEAQLVSPFREEVLAALHQYEPFSQAVAVFYGNDMSGDRRRKFSTENNFFTLEILDGGGISALEAAEMLGLKQTRLPLGGIPVESESI